MNGVFAEDNNLVHCVLFPSLSSVLVCYESVQLLITYTITCQLYYIVLYGLVIITLMVFFFLDEGQMADLLNVKYAPSFDISIYYNKL